MCKYAALNASLHNIEKKKKKKNNSSRYCINDNLFITKLVAKTSMLGDILCDESANVMSDDTDYYNSSYLYILYTFRKVS